VRTGTLIVGIGSVELGEVKGLGVSGASRPDFTGVFVP
jgi:hypothetical protein